MPIVNFPKKNYKKKSKKNRALVDYIVNKVSQEFRDYNPDKDYAVLKLRRDLRSK